jgi:RNA polymerase sigma-70 factor (ECF subfamily)
MEEMSYREISETLGIPVGTVTSRLLRARRKVREALR